MKTITFNSKSAQTSDGNFLSHWFQNQIVKFNEDRFGRMVIFLTLQSCVGSVAAMLGLQDHAGAWALMLSVAVTMWSNSMFIAQASTKWTLVVFYLSLIVSTVMIVAFV